MEFEHPASHAPVSPSSATLTAVRKHPRLGPPRTPQRNNGGARGLRRLGRAGRHSRQKHWSVTLFYHSSSNILTLQTRRAEVSANATRSAASAPSTCAVTSARRPLRHGSAVSGPGVSSAATWGPGRRRRLAVSRAPIAFRVSSLCGIASGRGRGGRDGRELIVFVSVANGNERGQRGMRGRGRRGWRSATVYASSRRSGVGMSR